MTNREKLQNLVQDIMLLDPSEFRFDLSRNEIGTWDSMAVVALAVGLQQTFGYHLTPDEANGITSVNDIIEILTSKGISFDE